MTGRGQDDGSTLMRCQCGLHCLNRRLDRVDHRLVVGLRLAALLESIQAIAEHLRQLRQIDRAAVCGAGGGAQEKGPVQRPGGPADPANQRHGDRAEKGADVVGRHLLLQPLLQLSHASTHVHPVIGIADGGIQFGQMALVLDNAFGVSQKPSAELRY